MGKFLQEEKKRVYAGHQGISKTNQRKEKA
jgi:hypothetical protein